MEAQSVIIWMVLLICLVAMVTCQPECICFETLATDLKSPTVLYEPSDGTGRLLIATLEGVIYVYYKDGSKENRPFLDIKDRVVAQGERGLLGLATHPNFKVNNRFYVYYTTLKESKITYLRLSQFEVKPGSPNRADPGSEVIMLERWKKTNVHHAGQLLFDKDRYLYVFIGDNGPQGDKLNQGQNRSTVQGSVLRLDVTNPATISLPYQIPPSNPYVGHPSFRPEIYAYGFRNPWSAKIDPGPGRGEGRIFVGDVGWARFEEVSILQKGGNYGWGLKEGDTCLKGKDCSDIMDEVEPIVVYNHGMGNSVIGGTVYRGCLNPSLTGLYIYADYGRGRFWYLKENRRGAWINNDLNKCTDCAEGLDNVNAGWIYNFGQDLEGEVYVLSTTERNPSLVAGSLRRIVDPNGYEDRKVNCAVKANKGLMLLGTPTYIMAVHWSKPNKSLSRCL